MKRNFQRTYYDPDSAYAKYSQKQPRGNANFSSSQAAVNRQASGKRWSSGSLLNPNRKFVATGKYEGEPLRLNYGGGRVPYAAYSSSAFRSGGVARNGGDAPSGAGDMAMGEDVTTFNPVGVTPGEATGTEASEAAVGDVSTTSTAGEAEEVYLGGAAGNSQAYATAGGVTAADAASLFDGAEQYNGAELQSSVENPGSAVLNGVFNNIWRASTSPPVGSSYMCCGLRVRGVARRSNSSDPALVPSYAQYMSLVRFVIFDGPSSHDPRANAITPSNGYPISGPLFSGRKVNGFKIHLDSTFEVPGGYFDPPEKLPPVTGPDVVGRRDQPFCFTCAFKKPIFVRAKNDIAQYDANDIGIFYGGGLGLQIDALEIQMLFTDS